jgi:hypothetical protein
VSSLLDLLNKFIGAVIAYGPKNKTKKARKARKAARRKKIAANTKRRARAREMPLRFRTLELTGLGFRLADLYF